MNFGTLSLPCPSILVVTTVAVTMFDSALLCGKIEGLVADIFYFLHSFWTEMHCLYLLRTLNTYVQSIVM